ncbi:MAG: hypothetical protein ACI8X5_004024, partial [Planctomycetota bacterium]
MRSATILFLTCLASCAATSNAKYTPTAESPAGDGAPSDSDLAKASQNPIADLISLPLQNNTNFDVGQGNHTQNILNIQPVIPVTLNEDWNLITRTILPVVSQSVSNGGDDFGLGDTIATGFFSPSGTEGWTWGVGPVVMVPTSTSNSLGLGEWGLGASAVGLVMTGPWVVGGLISNLWSVESSDLNLFTLQPFINYNLDAGWYLTTAPIVTSNWEATSGERWTVPLGGGAGRVFKIGSQPINVNLQYYD